MTGRCRRPVGLIRAVRPLCAGLLLLGLPVLVGCGTTVSRMPDFEPPAERQARLRAVEYFEAVGRLGVWSDSRSLSSRLQWRQSGNTTDIQLTAPLGLGVWRLHEDPSSAWFRQGGEPRVHGSSLDELLAAAAGLRVPVDQVGLWIRGLPGDGRSVRHDAAGRLQSLVYTDSANHRWQAEVMRYRRVGERDVPALIVGEGRVDEAQGQTVHYRLRWVLKEWNEDVDDASLTTPDTDSRQTPPRRLSLPSP